MSIQRVLLRKSRTPNDMGQKNPLFSPKDRRTLRIGQDWGINTPQEPWKPSMQVFYTSLESGHNERRQGMVQGLHMLTQESPLCAPTVHPAVTGLWQGYLPCSLLLNSPCQ